MIRVVDLAHSKPAVAVLALASHYVLANGEWDNTFHLILGTWVLAFTGLTMADYLYGSQAHTLGDALKTSTAAALVYFAVFFASILLHRGFFHRLRNVSRTRCPDLHGVLTCLLRYPAHFLHASLSSMVSSRA